MKRKLPLSLSLSLSLSFSHVRIQYPKLLMARFVWSNSDQPRTITLVEENRARPELELAA